VRWRGKTTAAAVVLLFSRHHAVALKQYDGYSLQAFPTPLTSLSPPVQHYSVHGPGPPPTLRIAVTLGPALSPTSPLHLLRPASVRVDDRLPPPPPPLCNRYHRWWCRRRRRRRFMGWALVRARALSLVRVLGDWGGGIEEGVVDDDDDDDDDDEEDVYV